MEIPSYICHACKQLVEHTDGRVYISHFEKVEDMMQISEIVFHSHCFEDIAGKEYLPRFKKITCIDSTVPLDYAYDTNNLKSSGD